MQRSGKGHPGEERNSDACLKRADGMIGKFFKDTKEYAYLCRYMARTGLKAEVANSYLNWIWWVLEPLASMFIYYCIFSHVLGRNQEYYLAFIYTGTLIWSYFDRCVLFAVQAIRLNRDIVTKTYVPKPVLILSNMLFNGFKMLISCGILIIVLLLQHVRITPHVFFVFPVLAVFLIIAFGVCLILMHFGVFVDDLTHAMRIGMWMLFYVSGVFYDLRSILPGGWGEILIRVNPVAAVIFNVRQCLLYGAFPEAVTMSAWFIIGVMLCLIGLKLSYTYENTYVKII